MSGPLVVLDACVLANFSLCDTLLRLAEEPSLCEPRWSEQIIAETVRTLEQKLDWPTSLTRHFVSELSANFGEAWIIGFDSLIARMTNDEGDRHVLACAVHAGASVIVTFNLRHFRKDHLQPWGIQALHPQVFLSDLFTAERSIVLGKLHKQALDRRRSLNQLLDILDATVPEFVTLVRNAL